MTGKKNSTNGANNTSRGQNSAWLSVSELEEMAMYAWVMFAHSPLWELVTEEWFQDARWREVMRWVQDHPEIPPGERWPQLMSRKGPLAGDVGLCFGKWVNSDTVYGPEVTLPELRTMMDQRRVQAILSQGLRLDPAEQDPAEWTLDALNAELAQRHQASQKGLTAAEGVVALTDQLYALEDQDAGRWPMLKTGFDALDEAIFGLWPEDFCVVGGRPGTGKTTLVLNMARYWLEHGKRVGYFSLEMSAASLHAVWVAQRLQWPVRQVLVPGTDAARNLVSEYANVQYTWPLRMWEDPCSLDELRGIARQWHAADPLDVVVVDYLQLLEQPVGMPKEEHVSRVSVGLRNLAKLLHAPVVAVSSSNRGNTSGTPDMRDLRNSGQIEHDATKVILTYEDTTGDSGNADTGKRIAVRVAKVRQGGQLGDVPLRLYPASQRMTNMRGSV